MSEVPTKVLRNKERFSKMLAWVTFQLVTRKKKLCSRTSTLRSPQFTGTTRVLCVELPIVKVYIDY